MFKKKGESIVEIIVAITILVFILTISFTMLSRTVFTQVDTKNRVIALNLAREGMEAVRNIRDTNWLKHHKIDRSHWICLDSTNNQNCPNALTNGFYTVDFSEEQSRYFLKKITPQNGTFEQRIDLSEVDINYKYSYWQKFRIYKDVNNNFTQYDIDPITYNTCRNACVGDPNFCNNKCSATSKNTPTIFYRQIILEIQNPYNELITIPDFCNNNVLSCKDARLNVTSIIQWKEQRNVREVVLETNLFDFYGRDSY